jgi:hypothetical protein
VIDDFCVPARYVFAGLFEQDPPSVNNYLEGKTDVQQLKLDDFYPLLNALKFFKQCLITDPYNTFDDCFPWARPKFEKLFNFTIRGVQATSPADRKPEKAFRSGPPAGISPSWLWIAMAIYTARILSLLRRFF